VSEETAGTAAVPAKAEEVQMPGAFRLRVQSMALPSHVFCFGRRPTWGETRDAESRAAIARTTTDPKAEVAELVDFFAPRIIAVLDLPAEDAPATCDDVWFRSYFGDKTKPERGDYILGLMTGLTIVVKPETFLS
jgi:hypothetical protein